MQNYNEEYIPEKIIRHIIATLLLLHAKDVEDFINKPLFRVNFYIINGYHPQCMVDFWEQDAFVFLTYLYGDVIAQRMLDKFKPKIEEAKKILSEQSFLFPAYNPVKEIKQEASYENIAVLGS